MSTKAASAVRVTIRDWRMASTRNNHSLEDLARLINPTEKGWLNYFGPVLPGELHAGPSTSQRVPRRVGAPQVQVQVQAVSAAGASVDALAGGHRSSRARPLRALASWRKAVGLYWKSRMRRELHVRFREGLGVKLSETPPGYSRYGLALHPDKTRLVPFQRPDRGDGNDDGGGARRRTASAARFHAARRRPS